MEVNEHIVQLTGTANIPQPLSLGHDYEIVANVNCYRVTEVDNHDGSINKLYKLKVVDSVVRNSLGKEIKTGKGSLSQKLRFAITANIQDKEVAEKTYENEMNKLIDHYTKS